MRIILGGLTILVFILGFSHKGFSQYDSLSVNNLKGFFSPNGTLFNKGGEPGDAGLVDAATGASLIYSSFPWMAGLDPIGNAKIGYEKYPQIGRFNAGQINGSPGLSAMVKVTKEEIEDHIANHNQTGYVVPDGILNWPTESSLDESGAEAEMAPFVDTDNNGIYNPENGDYPNIIGDEAIYLIQNDEQSSTNIDGEIHFMIYAFRGDGNNFLSNSIFLSIRTQNRGSQQLQGFIQSFWADFDLGNPLDDYMGTDTSRRVLYAYNSDNMDEDYDFGGTVLKGFGENPPAVGIKSVCVDFFKSMIYDAVNGSPATTHPNTFSEHYAYMDGMWRDRSRVTYGGNGHISTTGNAPLADFMFDGDPISESGWYEEGENLPGGDRSGLVTVFPIDNGWANFFPGWNHTLNLVIGKSPEGTSSNLGSIATMLASLDSAEQFLAENFKEHPFLGNSYNCSSVGVGLGPDREKSFVASVYPNPATDLVHVKSEKPLRWVRILDSKGLLIKSMEADGNDLEIDLGDFDRGLYLLQIASESAGSVTRRIIIN